MNIINALNSMNEEMLKGIMSVSGEQGPAGKDGATVTNVVTNANYTVTFYFSDGTSFTSDPLQVLVKSDWTDVENKPFQTVGSNLKVVDGALAVDTTDTVEEDNTKPITSSGVNVVVGNIDVLLQTI